MKILVADDSPYTRDSICAHLRKDGYETLEAQDGVEALELLRPNGVADETISAIISDCQMPRMSGLSLLQALDRFGMRIPFLLHSSSGKYRTNGTDYKLVEVEGVFDFAQFHLKSLDGAFSYVDAFLKGVR